MLGGSAEQVIAQEIGESLRGHRGDQRLPASLQRIQVSRRRDLGEEVVLQEIGSGQLQTAGIEGLEHGVGIEVVVTVMLMKSNRRAIVSERTFVRASPSSRTSGSSSSRSEKYREHFQRSDPER